MNAVLRHLLNDDQSELVVWKPEPSLHATKNIPQTEKEMNKALDKKAKIQSMCVEVKVSYEERVKMREREIANLKYTWRFGPAPALYLREVEEIYQSQTVGSWSPRDADVRHHFSQAELDRVPETVLRFVTYRGANFDAGRI